MNNLAYVAEIHVCLPRDTWSLRGRGGNPIYGWAREVSTAWLGMVFEDLEPLIGYHFLPCWPCVFGLILRWGNSQVVMDGLFHPFHFVEKIVILKKNYKVFRVVYTYWRRIFYYPHGICFSGLHIEKICLRWNEYSFGLQRQIPPCYIFIIFLMSRFLSPR